MDNTKSTIRRDRINEQVVRKILPALGVERQQSGGSGNLLVSAPYREDHHPSLVIRLDDGVWNDKATGDSGSLFDLVMLTKDCNFRDALDWIENVTGVSFSEPSASYQASPARSPNGRPNIVAKYPYPDEQGSLLYTVNRNAEKNFYPKQPNGQNGYGPRRVLYHLPEVINAGDEWVLLVEGEKDVERLRELGFVATTSPGGANGWRVGNSGDNIFLGSYSESLRGRKVAIIPDNDDPGWKYALAVARSIERDLGGPIAREVRIVELPDLGERRAKGGLDISDWLNLGYTAEDLESLIANAPDWDPESAPTVAEPEIDHWSDAEDDAPPTRHITPWPSGLGDAAYHGLAGEIVNLLSPQTEADPAAVLFSFLAMVGNAVGSGPHWEVSGSKHGLRFWIVQVGETSKARKGTSTSTLKPIFRLADSGWYERCFATGMSSGEGLIWAVRDPIFKTTAVKEKGRITGYQEEKVDPGITDKRLLVLEEEFASTLKVMSREGNSLSGVIRQAWDHGDLRAMTKNSPARATGAHVTIIGHTTQDELLRYLNDTEAANGFANRFGWICVRRSQLLPDGGYLSHEELDWAAQRVQGVLQAARGIGLIQRDGEATELWREVYGPLSEGGSGLLGAVTSRAEAQVMRIAAIYAVLDQSSLITVDHLAAALECWNYASASVEYIFGDALGDPVADTILSALRNAGELSQTEISNLFGRHQSAGRIGQALGKLLAAGKVQSEQMGTGGRPLTVWRVA